MQKWKGGLDTSYKNFEQDLKQTENSPHMQETNYKFWPNEDESYFEISDLYTNTEIEKNKKKTQVDATILSTNDTNFSTSKSIKSVDNSRCSENSKVQQNNETTNSVELTKKSSLHFTNPNTTYNSLITTKHQFLKDLCKGVLGRPASKEEKKLALSKPKTFEDEMKKIGINTSSISNEKLNLSFCKSTQSRNMSPLEMISSLTNSTSPFVSPALDIQAQETLKIQDSLQTQLDYAKTLKRKKIGTTRNVLNFHSNSQPPESKPSESIDSARYGSGMPPLVKKEGFQNKESTSVEPFLLPFHRRTNSPNNLPRIEIKSPKFQNSKPNSPIRVQSPNVNFMPCINSTNYKKTGNLGFALIESKQHKQIFLKRSSHHNLLQNIHKNIHLNSNTESTRFHIYANSESTESEHKKKQLKSKPTSKSKRNLEKKPAIKEQSSESKPEDSLLNFNNPFNLNSHKAKSIKRLKDKIEKKGKENIRTENTDYTASDHHKKPKPTHKCTLKTQESANTPSCANPKPKGINLAEEPRIRKKLGENSLLSPNAVQNINLLGKQKQRKSYSFNSPHRITAILNEHFQIHCACHSNQSNQSNQNSGANGGGVGMQSSQNLGRKKQGRNGNLCNKCVKNKGFSNILSGPKFNNIPISAAVSQISDVEKVYSPSPVCNLNEYLDSENVYSSDDSFSLSNRINIKS